MNHFWAEPGELRSQLEGMISPKGFLRKDGASRLTSPLYRWRADTHMVVAKKNNHSGR